MTLTADIGNSQLKLVIFDSDKPIFSHRDTIVDTTLLNNLYLKYDIKTTIISSVNSDLYQQLTSRLTQFGIKYNTLTHHTQLPFKILYTTPQTLGLDRIAAMAGAVACHGTKHPILVIDVGTCITYDLIVEQKFIGGNIAPGIKMRLTAMHQYTAALPNVEINSDVDNIGNNTISALQAGAFWGTIYEIDSYIQQYTEKYPTIKIIMTGGDATKLTSLLKKHKNIDIQQYLVPKGLNFLANTTSK